MIYPAVRAGRGYATILPDMDFETYSSAGYTFDETKNKWVSVVQSPPHSIGAVGSPAYAMHASTEILCLAYDLKQGDGRKLWTPAQFAPVDLFDHIRSGGLIEAHNSAFEWYIWNWVAVRKLGWIPLPYRQLRCSASKSRAWSAPSKLSEICEALDAPVQKMTAEGKRLIKKFSVPRQPTKHDPRRRIRPEEDAIDACKLYAYCLTDIESESCVSSMIPDLDPLELEYWLLDQTINYRGVHVDREALDDCIAIIDQATVRYNDEIRALTGGIVQAVSELDKLKGWIKLYGIETDSLDKDHIVEILKRDDLAPETRRALELRQLLGSASVKKLYSLDRRLVDGRARDLFVFCGADRTGRTAGRAVQPQNLPNSGADVRRCICGAIRGADVERCICGEPSHYSTVEWGVDAVDAVLSVVKERRLSALEARFGDAVKAISGCLRGLFSARAGYDLICSDFSAIEAVVLAHIVGEEWRIQVFKTHGKIYEASASKTFNVPLEEILEYRERTGDHHPLRKKGKVQELASGFGGGEGAWRAFGAEGTSAEIKAQVKLWRQESPKIAKCWYEFEDRAVWAVENAGRTFSIHGITYGYADDILYCRLPSGRTLTYHQPRLEDSRTPWGSPTKNLTYMGYNTDYKKGKRGWIRLDTWGGKLCENIVQSVARDLLFFSMKNIEEAGYPIVLQVHDEIVSEVPEGYGSVEEYEAIMSRVPEWATGWAVKASGGWRGKRYRK
jgi:DNA polymerase